MPRRTLVPLLGALVLLVGGCSGGSEPEPRAEPTPSVVSTSPAVESTAPVVETPEAFIRRWAQESQQMQNTGVIDQFSTVNEPDCEPCARLTDLVSGYYAAGGMIKAAPWTFVKIVKQSGTTFRVSVRTKPTVVKTSSTAVDTRTNGGPVTFLMTLAEMPGGWRMADYTQVAE